MSGLSPTRFEELFSKGARESGALFRLHGLPGSGKVGVATSKRIGNKPRRHRVRRRVLEALKTASPPPTLDLILVCHRNADGVPYEQLKSELRKLIEAISRRWEKKSE